MINEILELSKKLISIKSDPYNKICLSEALDFVLSYLDGFKVEKFESNGVYSALVYNVESRPSKFKILFNCHLDVIPGKDSQYLPTVKDDKLYGVGSMDMKSNLVVAMVLFKRIARKLKYPVAIQFVTDEEVGGFNGTKFQVENGVRSEFVIATEPTNLNIVTKAKGVLWLKVTSHGRTAHGAYPWNGENAIFKMNSFLNSLYEKFPIPKTAGWFSTVNLSSISTSNLSYNKIPDNCVALFDIRFTPEDKNSILDEFKKLLPKDFDLEIVFNEPSMLVSDENIYVQRLKEISTDISKKECLLYSANGTSDARHFSAIGCNGVEFGPIGEGIGTDIEYVDINSLEDYYKILEKFLLSL